MSSETVQTWQHGAANHFPRANKNVIMNSWTTVPIQKQLRWSRRVVSCTHLSECHMVIFITT